MSKNIFDIGLEYVQLMDEIEELEGELTEELLERLQINEQDIEDKIKAYRYIILQSDGNVAVLKDEISRLQQKISSNESLKKRLKDRITEGLQSFGDDGKSGNKIKKFPEFSVYTKITPSVIYNEESLKQFLDILCFSQYYNEDQDFENEVSKYLKCDIVIKDVSIQDLKTIMKDMQPHLNIEIKASLNKKDLLNNIKEDLNSETFTAICDKFEVTKNTSTTSIFK